VADLPPVGVDGGAVELVDDAGADPPGQGEDVNVAAGGDVTPQLHREPEDLVIRVGGDEHHGAAHGGLLGRSERSGGEAVAAGIGLDDSQMP